MSQISDLGLSLYFMSKNGKLLVFFFTQFSTLHSIKTRTYIRNLRHNALDKYVIYAL